MPGGRGGAALRPRRRDRRGRRRRSPPPRRALRFAGHTSGATGLDALAPLAAAGAATFSLHPLQTVPDGETDFTGCPCAISGSTPEAIAARRDAGAGARHAPVRDSTDSERAAYHAAACIASNFLVALQESAAGLLGAAGVERRARAARPARPAHGGQLVRARRRRRSPDRSRAATRRRSSAIARRYDERRPELLDLYEALAERTRATAAEGRVHDEDRAHQGRAAAELEPRAALGALDRPRADDGRPARRATWRCWPRRASAATSSS